MSIFKKHKRPSDDQGFNNRVDGSAPGGDKKSHDAIVQKILKAFGQNKFWQQEKVNFDDTKLLENFLGEDLTGAIKKVSGDFMMGDDAEFYDGGFMGGISA